MLRKDARSVPAEDVTMNGVAGTKIQWLLGRDDGVPNFALRRFTMEPDGTIPLHGHPWEHEIYVLSGEARVFTDTTEIQVGQGDVLYLAPDELHGYTALGPEAFVFLCVIPLSGHP